VGPSPGTFTRPGPGSPHHGAPQARSRPSGLGLLLRVRARDHRGPGAGTGCGLDPGTGAGIGAHPDQEHAHGAGWQAGRVALCSPAGVVRAGGAGRSGERAPGAPPTTVLPLPPAGVWNLVRLYIPSRYSDSGIVAPLGIVSSVFGAHPSDSGSERPPMGPDSGSEKFGVAYRVRARIRIRIRRAGEDPLPPPDASFAGAHCAFLFQNRARDRWERSVERSSERRNRARLRHAGDRAFPRSGTLRKTDVGGNFCACRVAMTFPAVLWRFISGG
jgi:hypothetical protein